MQLDALLRAHSFMAVERPPTLWEADTVDAHLIPLLGEMIAASLVRSSGDLAALTLNASNVAVPADASTDGAPPAGEFVALTVKGAVAWEADRVWLPARPWLASDLADLTGRLAPANVRYAYIRKGPPGSITVFLKRGL
jgi:hypothetical protein